MSPLLCLLPIRCGAALFPAFILSNIQKITKFVRVPMALCNVDFTEKEKGEKSKLTLLSP